MEQATRLQETVQKTPGLIRNRKYHQFQQTYRNNWIALVHDCFYWKDDEAPTHYQDKILGLFPEKNRLAVRGPRGLGKTALAAWITLGWALTFDGEDWKVGTTASAWGQLEDYLWPEIHKWAGRLRWDKIGRDPYNMRSELLTLKLKGQGKSSLAVAISSDDSEKIEGLHASFLKIIFDESKIIPEETWNSLEGSLSNVGKSGDVGEVLAVSTPGEPAGRFYDIHSGAPGYEDWYPIHITKEDAIRAGRITIEWAEQRKRQWGEDSALYQNQVLGEFAADHEDVIIPLAWVEAAHRRWDEWQVALRDGAPKGAVTSMGLDIALGVQGGDKPFFCKVYDYVNVEIEEFKVSSAETAIMELAGKAKGMIERYGVPMYIDTIGIGAGTYSRLKELKVKNAVAFTASNKAPKNLKDKTGEFTYRNVRTAAWFMGRDMLNPDDGDDLALPRSPNLTGELTRTRRKPILSGSVLEVESKKDIRKRLKRSTDEADSVLQALTGEKLAKRAETRVYVIGKGYITV